VNSGPHVHYSLNAQVFVFALTHFLKPMITSQSIVCVVC